MRRSTTSAVTDRRGLALLLGAQLIVALILVAQPAQPSQHPARVAVVPTPAAPLQQTTTQTLSDGRTVQLIGLGAGRTAPLLNRLGAEIGAAGEAVTAFWGIAWPRVITIVATASDAQFRALGQVGSDVAAVTTGQRILFAPGAAAMSADALRIVLRHELFHYAVRPVTAPDAPRWLTEGVADYVGRPSSPLPDTTELTRLPTDAELAEPGPARSLAYDRAWWFTRYVADRYGVAALRALYLRACAPGHPDVDTAVRDILGSDLDQVLAGWRDWRAR